METKRHVLVMTLLAVLGTPALAQSAADSAGIRQAALDYAEGYYAGDGARMRRALHPELAKRIVRTNNQSSRLDQMSALTLIEGTEAGYGTRTPADQRIANVRILDIFEGAASVRTEMSGWIDYMHLAKWKGKWVIVNVLWETKPQRE
jgi:hypothetical protein